MITASSTDGSITVAFTLHDGAGQVDTAVEDLTDAVDDVRIEMEIDALLDDPVPPIGGNPQHARHVVSS